MSLIPVLTNIYKRAWQVNHCSGLFTVFFCSISGTFVTSLRDFPHCAVEETQSSEGFAPGPELISYQQNIYLSLVDVTVPSKCWRWHSSKAVNTARALQQDVHLA